MTKPGRTYTVVLDDSVRLEMFLPNDRSAPGVEQSLEGDTFRVSVPGTITGIRVPRPTWNGIDWREVAHALKVMLYYPVSINRGTATWKPMDTSVQWDQVELSDLGVSRENPARILDPQAKPEAG